MHSVQDYACIIYGQRLMGEISRQTAWVTRGQASRQRSSLSELSPANLPPQPQPWIEPEQPSSPEQQDETGSVSDRLRMAAPALVNPYKHTHPGYTMASQVCYCKYGRFPLENYQRV